MNRRIAIIFLVLFGIHSFGQNTIIQYELVKFDSLIHKQIYQVEIDEFQKLELIEFINGDYEGALINKVWKVNKKEIVIKEISHKIKVPDKTVKKLIDTLKVNDFENLIDCEKIEDCIIGLDGQTILFRFLKKDFYNEASYWELDSDYYYNKKTSNIPNEVLKARTIFILINQEIEFKKYFDYFKGILPLGEYKFGGIIMKKE